MSLTKRLLILSKVLFIILITGCTNTLYQADLNVLNSAGKASKATLYWTKTEKLVGDTKAGPIILMTACSTRRINFDETDSGIIFRGTPGMDKIPGHSSSVQEGADCGQVMNNSKLTELKSGPLLLKIKCEAVSDEFTFNDGLYTSNYIQARDTPYKFDVQENSHWSFLGTILEAPQPPECE